MAVKIIKTELEVTKGGGEIPVGTVFSAAHQATGMVHYFLRAKNVVVGLEEPYYHWLDPSTLLFFKYKEHECVVS